MGKNLNVNLTFTANTQQAKLQIKNLQQELSAITSGVTKKTGMGEAISADLQKANQAAMQLKVALQQATNVKTGNVDLYKLDQIFKANKMSVDQYRIALQGAGAAGQKAFAQLNQAITNAQMPIRTTHTMIDSLWMTMKNTMRWQLTSSMLMGFTSAIRKAYGYAQDLNESLNNIRIVTGQSVEQMDKFALQANRAAKRLSTTTTAYTNAALIYYQQGLSDEEVLKRTDVTVKLANVAGETAETVSEWMTAIWNNFDEGGKTLEYYADVLTALGAATASSSDEIATGIEKFSAVAKNVGLSYEYAASALATVTAQTRQSADVVGTAFKTLFTRITDLELGKGLDDGTTLGQYSQTLADIGVNIKTTSGELRNMDNILNDLGVRWESLNGATRQAVAQSVAGIRQANQFIALMDNWDFFQQNLQVSLAAEGTLTDQADIYAESWDAASKRVKAAAEGIYDSILDDEFFIQITNGFADFLEGIERVVDSMGGLKGLLPGVLALMLQLFGNKMLTSVRDFSAGLKASGAAAEKVALGLKADSAQAASKMAGGGGAGTQESMAFGTNMEQQSVIQEKTWALSKNLTEEEKIRLQNLEQLNQEQRELTLQLAKQTDELIEQSVQAEKVKAAKEKEVALLQKHINADANLTKAGQDLAKFGKKNPVFNRNVENDLSVKDFSALKQAAQGNQQAEQAVQRYIKALQQRRRYSMDATEASKLLAEATKELDIATDAATEADRKKTEATANLTAQEERQKEAYQNTTTYLDKMHSSIDWGQSVVSLATGFSQLAMAVSSLQQLGSIWKNDDLSTGEKLLQTVMSVGMGLSTLVFAYKQIHSVINADTISQGMNTLARYLNTKQAEKQVQINKVYKDGIIAENQELDKNTGKQVINKASKEANGNKYTRHVTSKGVRFRNETTNSFISAKEGVGIFGSGSDSADWVPEKAGFKDKAKFKVSNFKAGATNKWNDFKAGAKTVGNTLGQFAPALIGIAVAAASVTAAVVLISNALQKEEKAFKAATESAQRFKEEYQKVADESNKLKDSISSYKEISSSLNDLVKGTNEYSEALIKANEQALELIKNNKDLKYEVINGQIVINQASLDEAYANQLAKQKDALVQSSIASQTANASKINYQNAEFSEDMKTWSDAKQTAANAGIGAAAGGVVGGALVAGIGTTASAIAAGSLAGSAVPVIGTIIGAVVGLIAGTITAVATTHAEGVAAEKEQEALKELQKKARENPDILKDEQSVKNALGDDYGADIVDALTEDMDALRDLIASNEALRQQNIALNATIASAIAKERGDEEYSEAINAYINKKTVNDDDYDSDWETLRESIDEEDSNLEDLYSLFYDKDTEGYITNMAGGNVTRVTYDENGKAVEKEVSQETISSEIANLIRKAALEGDTKKLKEIHELIDKSGSGDEIKEILDKYTIKSEDLDGVVQRAEANANKLTNIGFDSKDDAQIINKITGQLEGSLEDVDFSSLTREQIELIEQNQALWSDNSKLLEKIEKGISEYETKRMSNNLQASIDFDIEQNESDELNNLLKQTGMTAQEFQTYQKIIQSEYSISADNAYGLAKANLAAQSGITDLNKKIKENSEVLNSSNKNNTKYAQSIAQISTSISAWLGVELDSTFVDEHMELIKKAADGDKQAIKELQDLASQEFVINLDLMGEYENQLLDFTNTVNSTELTIGMALDTTEATKNLGEFVNKMILMGQMTTEQGVAYLQSMGFEVDENDMQETTLTTDELWRSDSTLWEKIKGTASSIFTGTTGKTIKTIDLSSVQYSGEGKTADLTDITDEKEKKVRSNKKKYEDEIERYYEIKEVLSDVKRELDKITKAKERAFGSAKLSLIDQEIAKQKELLQVEKDYQKEIEQNYNLDRNKLLSNYSVTLDDTGRISNYEEIYKQQIDRLNSIGEANDWEGDAYDKAKQAYDQFEKDIAQYTETLNLWEEQQQIVIDKQYEIADLALEKIEFKIQMQVEMADDDKAYLDFLMQKIEDDAFAAAEAIGYLGKEAVLTLDKIKANEEGIADVERALAAGEITPEQAVEKMREYRDELVDLNADLLEIRQTVQDKLTEAFEGWNEEIERGITKLEHYGSVLENYKNIIDIVGKDMLGISDETMSNLSKVQIANANNIIRATKAQLDANNSTLEKMRQARAEAEAREDKESVKEWDEQIKVAEEKSQELATTLQEALSNGLQLAADDFALTIEQIADSFSKAISGVYDDIEDMREGWDRIQEIADRYLETYEKTYEINKLNRKIQDSIDKTDSVASQKELRDLQNEMYEMTKDGQQLSKYDLEYLQKKYDLLVAEQAFRDAQNAKSVVRLQRDSEGNFGYVYTADQGTVDNAQQNYEDKLYAFQEYTHKMDEELAEMYISVQEQAYERMQAAAEMYGEGTEAFERERQKILEQYNIDMGYITDEYEKLTDRNLEINQRFNAGVAETYEQTFINSIVPQYQSFEQLYDETTTQCEDSCTRLDEAITLLQQTFDKQLELAGQDLEGFEKTANGKLEKIQGDSSITADKVEDMADRMDTALNGSGGAIDAVAGFQIAYSDQMETVRNATDLTIQKVNNLIQEYAKLAAAAGVVNQSANKSGTGSTAAKPIVTNPKTTTTSDTTKYTYQIGKASAQAEAAGYTRLEDSSGKYIGYAKTSDLTFNSGNTQANIKNNGKIYDYLVYDSNGKKAIGGVNGLQWTASGSGADWILDKNSFISFNGEYSKLFGSDTTALKNALKERAGYISVGGTRYYGFKYNNDYYFAKEEAFKDANAWGENPLLKKGSGLYKATYKAFDTGGYTGEWGPEGRLAMLHQKEIVLNAHDTENFLTAIGIVRDISDQIEKNALMTSQGLGSIFAATVNPTGDTLEQNVTIHAEFPNATNKNEIEEAFKSLVNSASQYANRKR